jgi:hypothetical protein
MKAFNILAVAAAALLLTTGIATAQVKTIEGTSTTVTATIEAIELGTRMLTVKDDKGIYETLYVPEDVTRFNALRVGDRITARYYDNVVVRVRKPGDAGVDSSSAAVTPTAGSRPGGTAAVQRTVTVTITAIDMNVPSITVRGPNGYVYSRKIQDPKAAAQLKVGDRLDLTWTEALLISVEPAK